LDRDNFLEIKGFKGKVNLLEMEDFKEMVHLIVKNFIFLRKSKLIRILKIIII